MNILNIGIPGLILIIVLALFIFGPNKLPELGRAIGETFHEFKKMTKKMTDDSDSSEGDQKA